MYPQTPEVTHIPNKFCRIDFNGITIIVKIDADNSAVKIEGFDHIEDKEFCNETMKYEKDNSTLKN